MTTSHPPDRNGMAAPCTQRCAKSCAHRQIAMTGKMTRKSEAAPCCTNAR